MSKGFPFMICWRLRSLAVGAALVGCLAAAGCSAGGSGTASPGPLEKTNLVLAAGPSLDSAAAYIAETHGYFADVGLHVTIIPAVSGRTVLSQQAAGKIDVSIGAYVSYILADADQHGTFEVIAPGSVIQPDTQQILVPPNSRISTVSQLQGKTVAVNVIGGVGSLMVESALSDNAVANPARAVSFKAIPFSLMAQALRRGEVDAAYVQEPFITEAEEQVGAVPLADIDLGTNQGLPVEGYMVTSAWARRYPHTAAAFQSAILRAQQVAATRPTAVAQGVGQFANTTLAVAAIAAQPEFPTSSNQSLVQRLANLMLNLGMLNEHFAVARNMFKDVPTGP
jgi:NitT/TauT family transport system substrate-binding protein